MALRIHTYPHNHRVWKSLIAARINKVDVEVVEIKIGSDNKTPEFLKMNPSGKVPVLETPTGAIYESNAILKYVARLRGDSNLLGANFFEQALVDQWLDWVNNEVETPRAIWVLPHFNIFPFKMNAYLEAKKDLTKALQILNQHFLYHTYLVGHQITVADLAVACALIYPFSKLIDPSLRKSMPNVVRWFKTIMEQPAVKAVVGEFTFATAEALAPGQTATTIAAPKPAPAPKAAPQPKAAAKKKDDDEEEDAAPKEEKKLNPLDLLPPSAMKLDDVKRAFFLKKPYNPDFFPAFWDNFDDKGYCIFRWDFKYNEDFEQLSNSCNLLEGVVTRCECMRKYAFGVLNLHGVPGDMKACGVWIFRGTEYPTLMNDVGDAEEFDFKKLDPTNPEDRAYFQQQMCDEKFGDSPVEFRKYIK